MERLATEGMTTMKRYLISVYQPDGPTPPPEVLDKIMTDLEALTADIRWPCCERRLLRRIGPWSGKPGY